MFKLCEVLCICHSDLKVSPCQSRDCNRSLANHTRNSDKSSYSSNHSDFRNGRIITFQKDHLRVGIPAVKDHVRVGILGVKGHGRMGGF